MSCCVRVHSDLQSSQESHRLVRRYYRQFRELVEAGFQSELADTLALTFRPGNHKSSFYDKALRQLGSSVAVVLTNGETDYSPSLAGFRAEARFDGSICYGLHGNVEFRHRYHFRSGNYGLDPVRNPSLFDTALRLNAACLQAAAREESLPTIPCLPRILLGFAPQNPPEFVDTPALRRVAAATICVSTQRLAQRHPDFVKRLLQQTWEAQLHLPGTATNPTDLLLVDAELCSTQHRPLRVWEDFRELVGAGTWNPARAVDLFASPNPAADVLCETGIDPGRPVDVQVTSNEMLEMLESRLRERLGDTAARFSPEDLYDGLIAPDRKLLAVSEGLPEMRRKLTTYWSECATDQDLRNAAHRPFGPLVASGACRVQVLRRRDVHEPYFFNQEVWGRRIVANWGCRYVRRRQAKSHARRLQVTA